MDNVQHYTFAGIVRCYPGEIGHIARYDIHEGYSIPLHDHDFFEVECGCAGRGIQILNGVTAPFQANEIYILRPEDAHSIHTEPRQHFVYYNIAFEAKRLKTLCETYNLKLAQQWLNDTNWNRKIRLSHTGLLSVRKGLQEIQFDTKSAFAADRFLMNFLYTLERNQNMQYADCPEWLQQTIEQLHDVKWLQMGPRALEKISGYSLEHISRILKKEAGVLPHVVLNRVRMEYAAIELTMGTKSIAEIIEDCGFDNTSHFFRLFKNTYNCTPRQYRYQNN